MCPICYEPFSSVNSCAIHSKFSHNIDYIYSIATVSQTINLIIKRDHTCMECNEQFQTLSLLIQHLDESSHGLHETDRFLCPIDKCYYRSKDFFDFKTHLILMHSNSFNSIDGTIQIKIKQLIKPYTYMHITRFLHKNQRDINEELKST